jgi:lipopolysaccharide transport system ATP-binding protein
MSSDEAVRVEGIGKRFRLTNRRWAGRFVDASPDVVDGDHFWALRDVSFSVGRGETLGLVGRNGAGKSTLLRILGQVTDPTEGRATIVGRIGSLLEVGAGFSADLSGRENIAMLGAILGMRRREIQARFDDIVAFSEVESFIDAPVKYYSSGMYLRLAFSVAAHLDTEVLLLDEALAVGDQRFRERCLTKIRELAFAGRTVIFVSHDAGSMARLCERALLIEHGRVVFEGATDDAMRQYRGLLEPPSLAYSTTAAQGDAAHLVSVERIEPPVQAQPVGQPLELELGVHVPEGQVPGRLNVLVELVGPDLWPVTGTGKWIEPLPSGHRALRCSLPTLRLAPSRYTVTVTLRNGDQPIETLTQLCPFEVTGVGLSVPAWTWRYVEDATWSTGAGVAEPGGFADPTQTTPGF